MAADNPPNPNQFLHPRTASGHGEIESQETAHGISINLPDHDGRPQPVKHMSAPTYQSPIRHHRRAPSRSKGVKETLDARSQYGSSDDASVHRINQYIIKQEIGRGSFGAVHLAVDQFGNEFAVKEFSKSRLRKRAQSNLLRKPNAGRRPGHIAAGLGFNAPLHLGPNSKQSADEANNSLSLIKEEIAIMKKLNHNNLVSLIEVLDDPQEDSLYMVLEMCKKGVAMHVGLEERAEPYDDETCRCWFRDMILGIEYLHAQGIIHRDIKPDNCLITNDDVLKIVDFGVSEMFEKQSEMATAKSAGSPAFMPPELCVAKHGQVSGRAADIWSMGVTLYCLRYGHIPFEKGSMLELYDSIRGDDVPLDDERDADFRDLMLRMLEKDPEKRITMEEIRNHAWVTKKGTDTLLPAEENCADLVEPPTEAEMDHAITGNMANLLAVMKATKRFKSILSLHRGRFLDGIFGREKVVAPPHTLRSHSQDTHDRHPLDKILVTSGIHRDYSGDEGLEKVPSDLDNLTLQQSPEPMSSNSVIRGEGESRAHYMQRMETDTHHPSVDELHQSTSRATTFPLDGHAKGQAHDPLEDTLFLNIGSDPEGAGSIPADAEYFIVSESPPAVEMNIYEQAYQDEMQRILERRGREPSMYLTRRIEHREDIRSLSTIKDAGKYAMRTAAVKFQGISRQGWEKGQDLGDVAKSAAGKFSESWASSTADKTDKADKADKLEKTPSSTASYIEPWKQYAKDTATAGYEKAGRGYEKLGEMYNRSSTSGKISGLMARAQAKVRGDASATTAPEPTAEQKEETPTPQSEPKLEDAITEPAQEAAPPAAQSEEQKTVEPSKEASATVKSAFTEHIT